ncbi:DUF839 domain-containing protein [Gallaecimonas kandeliae]|uniref:alkaline phosphatase PhoX n=1 Tax=Gallaecimonas kandeliae TaxID=3029055 RepID=UPI002648A4C0|nr:alkaline phosphatase PhoX [Gallaecimonas kandeliae]WKE66550.1 DUF839 domain-containing protein [Gallaecimonas kandeliae]
MTPNNWKFAPVALAVLLGMTACNDSNNSSSADNTDPAPAPPPAYTNVSFSGVEVPTSEADKLVVRAIAQANINGVDQQVGYQPLMATGHQDPVTKEVFGLVKDKNDAPIHFEDGSNYLCNGTNAGEGSGLDNTSILQKNGKIYMVSQFECAVGAMYATELKQSETGALTPVEGTLQFISQKDQFGGWVHCAGMTTPWESHLSSEEYEPDARYVEEHRDANTGLTGDSYFDETAKYWGDATKANPYYYGWTPEVTIGSDGKANYTKHYAMGRMSHELSYVMPDERTVYLSDDGANVGFFMFVADKAGDLSAGTLYGAKWHQRSAENGGVADLEWISLGHSDDASVREWVAKDLKFSDIFDTKAGTDLGDGSFDCGPGFQSINASAGQECLALKDINEDGKVDAADELIASRLETRRWAALQGATTEFRKEEGITFNAHDGKLYVAMSEITRGMEDFAKNGKASSAYDKGGYNDMKLNAVRCGGVYELNVGKNADIGSDFVAKDMSGMLMGRSMDYSGTAFEGNSCDLDGLASPDNLTYLPESNSLVIGEDTGYHQNNMIWSYDLKTKSLTRLLTVPLDAETTSAFWHKDVGGFGYLVAVSQHPLVDQQADEAAKQSEVGYLGPFRFKVGSAQ